jgi:hypothetical protein
MVGVIGRIWSEAARIGAASLVPSRRQSIMPGPFTTSKGDARIRPGRRRCKARPTAKNDVISPVQEHPRPLDPAHQFRSRPGYRRQPRQILFSTVPQAPRPQCFYNLKTSFSDSLTTLQHVTPVYETGRISGIKRLDTTSHELSQIFSAARSPLSSD